MKHTLIHPKAQADFLREILKESNSPLQGISGLEVYNAFTTLFGQQPMRSRDGRCLYSRSDIEQICRESIMKSFELHELEDWKKRLPLAFTLSRRDAVKRLVAIGKPGWLSRCVYERGKLLLCKSDAEQLCFLRKTGYGELPAWWSV